METVREFNDTDMTLEFPIIVSILVIAILQRLMFFLYYILVIFFFFIFELSNQFIPHFFYMF